MGILPQSPVVSHSSFPPRLMLCAPKIAGLLSAPKAVEPPTPREARIARMAAYIEMASARLQTRFAEIDAKTEALRAAYNIRPREITINPTSTSKGGAA